MSCLLPQFVFYLCVSTERSFLTLHVSVLDLYSKDVRLSRLGLVIFLLIFSATLRPKYPLLTLRPVWAGLQGWVLDRRPEFIRIPALNWKRAYSCFHLSFVKFMPDSCLSLESGGWTRELVGGGVRKTGRGINAPRVGRENIVYIVAVTAAIVINRLEFTNFTLLFEFLVRCPHQITDLSSTPAVCWCDQLSPYMIRRELLFRRLVTRN